jgi:predicted nucleic acid-binding protein
MTYLLDVAPLIALLFKQHVHNSRVSAWEGGADLAVCPLTELGFLRISTQPSIGLSVQDARRALKDWREKRKPKFIACDLETLDMDAPSAGTRTTDFYLASLAAKHGMELATLDESIGHKAAFLIPN